MISGNDKRFAEEFLERVSAKLRIMAPQIGGNFPNTNAADGRWDPKGEFASISNWTTAFWPGMMWLMYEATGNEEFRKTAEISEEKMDGAFAQYKDLHHDVGFMWHIMSGASYRLTGNQKSCTRNLFAASVLSSRYNIDGDFIQAWDWGYQTCSIIDSMMNLPLLYWASREVDNPRFKRIAMRQADMTMRDHIRRDGSVYHVVSHETEKIGVVDYPLTQGYDANTSCWSRGLAWAIYGFILSYIHTEKKEYLDTAIKTANFFITNCSKTDYLPLVDFRAPKEPVYYDSVAGVCAACGMLEIAKHVSECEADVYVDAAIKILKAIDTNWCNYEEDEDAIVMMGTELYPHEERQMKGVHIPMIYGDFFFVEALCKLKGRDFLIW